MRIHGVRLIAVRMSPSRRCQTSWRARPTTADADVGIEGTDVNVCECERTGPQSRSVGPALPALQARKSRSVGRVFSAQCGTRVGDSVKPRNAGLTPALKKEPLTRWPLLRLRKPEVRVLATIDRVGSAGVGWKSAAPCARQKSWAFTPWKSPA